MNLTIISGGQTGADQGGLFAAKDSGIKTGGYIIKNFMTENGPMPRLAEYGIIPLDTTDYVKRTAMNAKTADITLWFGSTSSRGFMATRRECGNYGKPFLNVTNMSPSDISSKLLQLLNNKDTLIVNIAGNRESSNPGIQNKTYNAIKDVISILKNNSISRQTTINTANEILQSEGYAKFIESYNNRKLLDKTRKKKITSKPKRKTCSCKKK